ncbi:uncharacterized protein LOC108151746 [Drosophila miranda]|uniref:uncharacterized protein LOC108151746 n=1 Tax=Drosophila miranda TaxID=7229 RepID=UPI0007E706D9|nr:uncharacterized protein LOC108151746 [Drosophila miranda]
MSDISNHILSLVSNSAHLNFIHDFREAFGDDGMYAFELINKAADAWQGLTPKEKLQFEKEQYLAARRAEMERVKRGESAGLVWAEQKKAFRKLAKRGQAKYKAEFKVEGMQWGRFKENEPQLKRDDASSLKYRSCFFSVLGIILDKCRSKRQSAQFD